MAFGDNTYFAPEALVDDKRRMILWVWLLDNSDGEYTKIGYKGVYAFPRVLWLEDGILHMSPAPELDKICYNEKRPKINKNGKVELDNGEVFRIKSAFRKINSGRIGFSVRESESEQTLIYYDADRKSLVLDTTNSGCRGERNIESLAPFVLSDGEDLSLDIFVDRTIVEVYANERQAICRRIFPEDSLKAVGVSLIGDADDLLSLSVFEIAPTNPY